MDDLTKGYREAPKAAGEIDWPVPESDAPDIGPWIAFMRGEDLPIQRQRLPRQEARNIRRASETGAIAGSSLAR